MRDEPLRVYIVDDHGLLRNVMCMALDRMDGIAVAGQAENGRDAVDEVLRLSPDIVLMDILMPLLDGIEATRRIRRDAPDARVLVLTGAAHSDAVLDVLRAGASGLIPKTAELAELETAIRAVADGEVYVSPELAGPVLAQIAARPADAGDDDLGMLSSREREVIQLIGEGQSTREIADGLVISPKTVAQHKANIVKKLRLHNTRELQVFAARRLAERQQALVGHA